MKRRKQLFQQVAVLLENFDCTNLGLKWFDIPFELSFPTHDEITFGFGPCSQLLPCSLQCSGKGGWKDDYEAEIEYSLIAVLTEPSSIPFLNSRIAKKVAISPFLTFDPRLIQLIMHTDERKWKSHVGAKPVEYEIEVGSMVFGPNDTLKFSYRILVNSQFARCGIRVRRVQFILKEYHWIGEDRCCVKDDQHDWGHGRPFRVRGQRELCRWSQVEFPPSEPPSPKDHDLAYPSTENGKYDGLAIFNRKFPGSDGIYVERSGVLQIPSLEDFNPSTARPLPPANDHICRYERPRKAFVAIRHTITCMIEMRGSDTISIEAGCYLAGVGLRDCVKMLNTDSDVLPTLDYQKMSGISELDHWVPHYYDNQDLKVQEGDSFHAAKDFPRDGALDPDAIEVTPKVESLQEKIISKIVLEPAFNENALAPQKRLVIETGAAGGSKGDFSDEASISTKETHKSYNSTAASRVLVSPLDNYLEEEAQDFPAELPPDYYHDDSSVAPRLRYPLRNTANLEVLDLTLRYNLKETKAATKPDRFDLEDAIFEAMDSTFFEM